MWSQVNDVMRESVRRVLTSLAAFLPGLVAMLLSVLLAALIGAAAQWIVRRILGWARFDQRLERWGASLVAEWSPRRSPTLLIARLVFWAFVVLGALIGLAALDATLTTTMLTRLLEYIPNIVAAVLVVLVGTVLGRYLSRSATIGAVNLQLRAARLIGLGVKWLVFLATAAMALDHLAIGGGTLKLAFGIVFAGIVFALALAVGLGSKEHVTRSLERWSEERDEPSDAPVQHL